MKIHVLQCGSIRVDLTVPFGKRLDLIEAAKQLTAADKNRITLPVFTYLIEHPKGLILVDTGWCREISPDGVYDPKAAAAVLPSQMVALFHPFTERDGDPRAAGGYGHSATGSGLCAADAP